MALQAQRPRLLVFTAGNSCWFNELCGRVVDLIKKTVANDLGICSIGTVHGLIPEYVIRNLFLDGRVAISACGLPA